MAKLFFHGAIIMYSAAVASYAAMLVFKKREWPTAQIGLIAAGLGLETVYIVWRWSLISHPPVFGTFENGLASSWFMVVLGLMAGRKIKTGLIYLLTPLSALAVLAYSIKFSHLLFPLTISETSLWVDFHVVFAWLAFSSIGLAAGIGLLLVRPGLDRFGFGLPAPNLLEDWLVKYTTYAFITMTITITSGSYYALLVFGRWWKWDPIESLSLILWLFLALTIHLKRSFGWKGSQLAWLVWLGMITAIAAYWLLLYFPFSVSYHIFDIQGRVHTLL